MKDDLHKDPRELEREADGARSELEHTLEAIEQRLSPGALLDQVMSTVRQNGGEFGSNLAAQVRSNPLPTLLVSAGLTWLMAASKTAPERGSDAGGPSVGARASAAAGSAKDAAHRVSEGASDAAAGVRDAMGRASDAGSRAVASTRRGAQDLREGWGRMTREHPLVLGAIAVAAGAAMAAWLPATEQEDEWAGDASDEAKSRAGKAAKKQAEKAGETLADAADSARERAQARDSGSAGEQRPAGRQS